MTNLSKFFADADVSALRELGLESHGVDIAGVYCLHTGRQVGTFDDSVIQFAVDEESTDDPEILVDALLSRVIASMRPSPMLNRPDRQTLSHLATKHPVDILCYLANRLTSSRDLSTRRPSGEFLEPFASRIKLHQQWTYLAAKGVNLTPWIHWLLELDAKRNLHDISPPQVELDRLNRWLITSNGTFLLALVTPENAADLLATFELWTFARIGEYDARDSKAEAQQRWMRGNTMSQPAYFQSWIENPQFATKRAEQQAKAKGILKVKGKPVSERAAKQNGKVAQFLHLLEDIMDNDAPVTPAKPKAAVRTAGSLFAAKKES